MKVAIADLLDPQMIVLDLESNKKKEIIAELVSAVQNANSSLIQDVKKLNKELLSRERDNSTGIGDGIAIPHTIVEGLAGTVIAFGRKKSGVNFQSIDGKPAHLFFLILAQKGKEIQHLQTLSKLSRLLHNVQLRENLLNARTAEEIIELFQFVENQ